MEKVKLMDAGGDTMTVLKFSEVKQPISVAPGFLKMDFSKIRTFPVRDDDVILCSYPRSGCHWVWELMHMISSGKAEVETDRDKDVGMLELHASFQKEVDSFTSPRMFNTHLWFTLLPAEIVKKQTKLVILCRNPKDVCVSWYLVHRNGPWYDYKGRFENWLQAFMEGAVDWGAYSDWLWQCERMMEQHPDHPVHIITYDRLKENPIDELSSLSRFLGKEHDSSFLQSVLDACALEKMRTLKTQCHVTFEKLGVSDSSSFMYRQGKAGGWKEWFTVAQSEDFDRQWSEAMAGSKVFSFLLSS